MKNIKILFFSFIITILLCINSHSEFKGVQIRDDHYAHIFFSAYISEICKDHELDPLQTTLIMTGIGILKELWDMESTGFSIDDICFNISGVCLSYSIDFVLLKDKDD